MSGGDDRKQAARSPFCRNAVTAECRQDHVVVATRGLHEAVGRPDRVRARVGRDADRGPAGRAARARCGPVRDGADRRLRQPRRPSRRPLRGRLGRPAPPAAAAHLVRRDPGRAPVLDPGGLSRRRASDRVPVRRRVPRRQPRGALRYRIPCLRPVVDRSRRWRSPSCCSCCHRCRASGSRPMRPRSSARDPELSAGRSASSHIGFWNPDAPSFPR